MIEEIDNTVYLGPRDNTFETFIKSLLERSKLKTKYIDFLTDHESMKIYGQAFTSSSANVEKNYEVFEQLGDVTANKFIVWYMYRRFPQLSCTQGVKVVARLRINYGAKQSFSDIGEKLGFWNFISATVEDRSRKKKPLLEDALEAFIGATEFLIDTKIRLGVGYSIVYDILSNIFDEIPISLRYEDLYDSKTRLKELFDIFADKLGVLKYVETRQEIPGVQVPTVSRVYRIANGYGKNKTEGGQTFFLGEGTAALKGDAQQKAATQALTVLNSQGYVKDIPLEYSFFCQD
jgi:dsRNA-specific ribonuclease